MKFSRMVNLALLRLKIICSSIQNIIILFILPPLLILLSGQIIHGITEPENIPIAIVDHDQSTYSQTISHRISENSTVEVFETDENKARQHVLRGNKEAVLIFPSNFQDKILDEELDNLVEIVHLPQSIMAELISEMAAGEVMRIASNVTAANMVLDHYRSYGIPIDDTNASQLWEQAWLYTEKQWEPGPTIGLETEYYTPGDTPSPAEYQQHGDQLVAVIIIISILTMFLSIFLQGNVVQEKNNGIGTRIKTYAEGYSINYFSNSIATWVLISLTALLTIITATLFLYEGENFSGILLSLILLYSLSCTGIAFFLAQISKTTGQLQFIGILITALTSIIGIIFYYLDELASSLGIIVKFVPQSWLIMGARDLIHFHHSWEVLILPAIVLISIAVLFYILGQKVGTIND